MAHAPRAYYHAQTPCFYGSNAQTGQAQQGKRSE